MLGVTNILDSDVHTACVDFACVGQKLRRRRRRSIESVSAGRLSACACARSSATCSARGAQQLQMHSPRADAARRHVLLDTVAGMVTCYYCLQPARRSTWRTHLPKTPPLVGAQILSSERAGGPL